MVRPGRTTLADRIPGVRALAALFERLARLRVGRVPVGLLALVPVALAIDLLDVPDELLGGPVGMGVSFFLEAAFLLALTGRPGYAIGLAGIDLVPLLDTLPLATIMLVRAILRAWATEPPRPEPPVQGPVIDV